MISRCPSCAAEVSEDAKRCPSCFWDFEAFKKIPPGSTPPPKPNEAPKAVALPPPKLEEAPKPIEPALKLNPPIVPTEFSKPAVPPPPPAAVPARPAESPRPEIPRTQIRQLPARVSPPDAKKAESKKRERTPAPRETKVRRPGRSSSMLGAAIGALALAAVFIGIIYFLTRPETSSPSAAAPEAPVFEKRAPAPLAPPAAVPTAVSAAPPSTRTAPAPASTAQPTPLPAPVWIFEGTVYDLVSLAPVYEVQLSFKDAAGAERGQAATDSRGRYRVSLEPPARGGYAVSISHPDYKDAHLDEIDPPYRTLDHEQRKALSATKIYSPPWKGQTSKPTRKDFALIPNE